MVTRSPIQISTSVEKALQCQTLVCLINTAPKSSELNPQEKEMIDAAIKDIIKRDRARLQVQYGDETEYVNSIIDLDSRFKKLQSTMSQNPGTLDALEASKNLKSTCDDVNKGRLNSAELSAFHQMYCQQ